MDCHQFEIYFEIFGLSKHKMQKVNEINDCTVILLFLITLTSMQHNKRKEVRYWPGGSEKQYNLTRGRFRELKGTQSFYWATIPKLSASTDVI